MGGADLKGILPAHTTTLHMISTTVEPSTIGLRRRTLPRPLLLHPIHLPTAANKPDDFLALFGQHASSSSSKKKGKRERKGKDHSNATCYGCGNECGEKGHVWRKCPDGEEEKSDENENEDQWDGRSEPAKGMRKRVAQKHHRRRST